MGPMEETMAHVRALLRASGVKAASEPADAELPGVILFPDSWANKRLDSGVLEVGLVVLLVAGGSVRQGQAIRQLDGLVTKVADALPELSDLAAATVTLPNHSPDPIPALRGTVLFHVTPN